MCTLFSLKSSFSSLGIIGAFFLMAYTGLVSAQQSGGPSQNPNGRNDEWGFAGYGGGGAMFYPAVSPFNERVAFVACDMTGSFVTYNGGASWRMFNLRNHVNYFVFDPTDSNTIYANSIGLFKSSDKGKTWNIIYPAPDQITKIISKGDHASELILTKDRTEREVLCMAVDPHDGQKLYAVISIDKAIGFYTTTNGGSTWKNEKVLTGPVSNIYVNPASAKEDRTIYLAASNGTQVREHGSWVAHNGPEGVKKLTTFSGGYDRQLQQFIIYAMTGKSYFNPAGDPSGIYFTNNGGATWENRQQGLLQLALPGSPMPEWRTIATSALHPGTVYVSYNGLKIHADTTAIGVAKSDDFGKTWKAVWQDKFGKKGYAVSPNFKPDWLNDRFGPSWGENPFSIGVSPSNPDVCYATDFGRTIMTPDGGTTWQQVYSRKNENGGWSSRGLEVTTGYCVVFDPFNIRHVFIANTDIGLMESNDGAESWTSATKNNGVPREWMNSTYWLTFDPATKGKAWAAMSNNHDLPRPKMWRHTGVGGYRGGILETNDGGKTWRPVTGSIGEGAFTHVLIDPSSNVHARTLYACAFGKGVYKSIDGGKSWSRKNKGLPATEPFAWRITRRSGDGALFLIVSRRSDDGSIGNEKDGAVYRSLDGADSWTKLLLPEGTNGPTSIATDGSNPHQLLLAAWGRAINRPFSEDTGGGIFQSMDDGKTWKNTLSHDQHIHDLTFDPRNKTWYACGFNGSAYRSADNGTTWSRIKGYNFKWGKRVDLDPRDPGKIFIVTFGGGVWYGPAKGDEHASEDITTPVLIR